MSAFVLYALHIMIFSCLTLAEVPQKKQSLSAVEQRESKPTHAEAETTVEVGLEELTGKKIAKKPVVQSNYGQEIVRILLRHKLQLTECIPEKSDKVVLDARWSIDQKGAVQMLNIDSPENAPSGMNDCVVQILKSIKYPIHGYSKNIQVHVPIALTRESL